MFNSMCVLWYNVKCSTFSHGITCIRHFCFFVVARKWFPTISKLCLSFQKKKKIEKRNLFEIVVVVVSSNSVLLLLYLLASQSLNPLLNCSCLDEAHLEHVAHKIFKESIFEREVHTSHARKRKKCSNIIRNENPFFEDFIYPDRRFDFQVGNIVRSFLFQSMIELFDRIFEFTK